MKTSGIVVVGGGAMGTSIAYHLAEKGARDVLLLDRGALCSGETAKSGGFVQTHWTGLAEVRLIARSRNIFRNWGEIIGGDCGWIETGYLHVTGPDKEESVRSTHNMLLDEALESHWLDQRELKKLQPLLNVNDLTGGAWEPQSGWADPVKTVRSLAEAAQRKGVTVREGVTVLQISHRSGRIEGVETDQGFISSPVVVLAAGPWTPTLHPNPVKHLPLETKRGQVCYMTRPNGLPRKELAFYDEVTGLYTHCDGDTQLVGIDWDFDFVTGADRYDRELDQDYAEAAYGALVHRFPSLRDARIVRGVVGIYDFTPDGWPMLDGDLGLEGYFVAAGFSGAGFKSSLSTGLAMAELVLDGKATSVDIDFLRRERFFAQ